MHRHLERVLSASWLGGTCVLSFEDLRERPAPSHTGVAFEERVLRTSWSKVIEGGLAFCCRAAFFSPHSSTSVYLGILLHVATP